MEDKQWKLMDFNVCPPPAAHLPRGRGSPPHPADLAQTSTSYGSRTSNARMRGALLDTIAHSQLLQGDANDSKAGAVQVRARPSPPSAPCGTHCSCGGGARFEWMAVRSSWAWVRD